MEFDQELVERFNGTCPPEDADVADCMVYRAVAADPATPDDFRSYVKLRKVSVEKSKCDDWGLSVWRDLDAVEHARSVIPLFRERYIAGGEMGEAHGKIKASPSKNQPKHFTFWNYYNVNLSASFSIVMPPIEEGA
ncbi:hypothetical protein HJB86_21360 [Rhizobium sp. NZLR3b]|uniref:hypothetical protein n=1 Tax=Rhizobium sp. NZLR3b TaxID=2731101 RepID=UPI001C83320A|nr:hypothetical protein [Rhizobium sp. NZLR3b]MBX5191432.1 hypothetical protein [Rhizobium sp. NZLR3b]